MTKRMLVDAAHPEETRVVVLNGNRLEEFDFETSTKKQIKGNIYLAKVTRVEPSLQAAFVEYGGNRHGFLAFSEIHPDYYRIPVADRQAALAADRAAAEREREEHEAEDVHWLSPETEPRSERMAHAAPADEIRSEEVDDEPVSREPDESEEADAHFSPAEEAAAVFAPPAEEASYFAAPPFEDSFTGHEPESPEESAAETGDADGRRDESAEDAHDSAESAAPMSSDAASSGTEDVIETVGGDEIEEATRRRARPLRHYKIQEVIKRRQIMLVQVTKEERGNKGAALTTYLSLAGRYCVLMPNTPRGGGVSRKITNATDRRRLKELMSDLDVPDGMGVIVRTAGSERSKAEIKRDFEYLLRLWEEIRDLTLKSTAPALIYEEGNLIKRSIRDLYTRDLEEVIVDGEEGYRTAKAFMKMLMPSHAKRVKPYRDPSVPLFHRFQVENQIDAIHSPVVQLRSGGYIVINPTEALVSIDVNSGRSTKERNIEETALKTNIEAAEEIARQLRLRDLAGLIVIDFIDMEEHRNQSAVERRLKEAMRHDRARIQLGRISPFGLLELSRQRLRPSLLEASTQPCPHCNGTGHIRSTESTALHVLRAIEEEGMRRRSAEISVAVPTVVALYILNQKRAALQQAEARYGFQVTITNDDSLVPPAFRLERLRNLTPAEIAALPAAVPLPEPEEDEDEGEEDLLDETGAEEVEEQSAARADGDEARGRRRRRRRRRRGDEARAPAEPTQVSTAPEDHADETASEEGEDEEAASAEEADAGEPGAEEDGGERRRRRRGRRGGRRRRRGEPQGAEEVPAASEPWHAAADAPSEAPAAETPEFIPPQPVAETPEAEMAEAFEGPSGPSETTVAADLVPVADAGDEIPAAAAEPAAPQPEAAEDAERTPVQYNVPEPHQVTGPTTNPRRGWWRRR